MRLSFDCYPQGGPVLGRWNYRSDEMNLLWSLCFKGQFQNVTLQLLKLWFLIISIHLRKQFYHGPRKTPGDAFEIRFSIDVNTCPTAIIIEIKRNLA